MRVAILSDIHDHLANLRAALERAKDAEALICCGDLCSPFVVPELGRGFAGPVHVVFGNNDGDRYRIVQQASAHRNLTLYGEFAELELGGLRFAVHHFDDVGRALARGGGYDVVCFGHNHRFELEREGPTLRINPGEIFGGLTGAATFVMLDTRTGEGERVEL